MPLFCRDFSRSAPGIDDLGWRREVDAAVDVVEAVVCLFGMGSSMESRWVAGDFEISDDEDFGRRSFESVDEIDDDDDNENNNGGRLKQRLIRTSPKYDAFDVDALVVPGVQRNDSEVCVLFIFIFESDQLT